MKRPMSIILAMSALLALLLMTTIPTVLPAAQVIAHTQDSIGATSSLPKTVYGFWPYWQSPASYQPDWSALTHVTYFCVEPESDGSLEWKCGTDEDTSPSRYLKVRDAAHSQNVKALITVQAIYGPALDALDNILAYHRQDFADNVLELLQDYGADGVCIDFEYPNEDNSVIGGKNKPLIEDLMHVLHSTLKNADPNYHISLCVAHTAEWEYLNPDLAQYTDAVFIMAYGAANGVTTTQALSPYYEEETKAYGVKWAANRLNGYYPPGKIILGLPFYGYQWACSSGEAGATITGATKVVFMQQAISKAATTPDGRLWDSTSRTPWYRYESGGVWYQCWYEDEESLGLKLDYVNSANLGGAGFWVLGREGNNADIWNVVKAKMGPRPSLALDVFMLVDLTGSFSDDLPVFKTQAPDLIAALKSSYPDIRFGLGKFEDYPISPFGSASSGDKAYQRLIDLTSDAGAVLSIIAGLYTRFGDDTPESQLVALYQAATGAGQDLSGLDYPGASIPAGQQANFRDGATKIFLLWTDAPFHHPGDPGSIPYPGPSFDETVNAILALDPPMVIGISSGGGGLTDLQAIAAATGALAPSGGIDINGDGIVDIPEGQPLVATIGYSGQGIAAAIESLVEGAAALPIADAGGPYAGEVGETIVFDGSGSFDPDGWIVLYEWDFESDGVFDFNSATPAAEHAYPAVFSGVATLRVTDNDGNTATDTSLVEISLPSNPAPIADAGPDQTAERTSVVGAEVTLDGSGSYDPDGDPLTYGWTWAGGSASGVSPAVTMPMGTTEVTLEVSDGTLTDIDNVLITVQDTAPPMVTVEFPTTGLAVQDGITLKGSASDLSGVGAVYFYVREPDCPQGQVISSEFEDLPATFNSDTAKWEYSFDTLALPDGNYIVLAKGVDMYDNEGWSDCVPSSIRNWAVIELLPASQNNKAGRTMPVKFALRVSASVDPSQPFVWNDELTIKIFATSNPAAILQTSTFGSESRDYRIDDNTLYITNFRTLKTPTQYTVEVWRTSKNFMVGSFTFATVK